MSALFLQKFVEKVNFLTPYVGGRPSWQGYRSDRLSLLRICRYPQDTQSQKKVTVLKNYFNVCNTKMLNAVERKIRFLDFGAIFGSLPSGLI